MLSTAVSVPRHPDGCPGRVVEMSTFHDFEMTSITGEPVSFDRFRGQICLVVNVASH
jgi:hypothetical protein